MTNRLLTIIAFAVLTGTCTSAMTQTPNIVLLFVDDLGWADVHYKPGRFNIPNIEKLMTAGMTFTDAYAASPTCSPSRASILTGQHPARLRIVRHVPHHNGEWNVLKTDPAKMPSRNWLPLEVLTFAEALKAFGYNTAFVGKWHLGPETHYPDKQGFDEIHGVTERGAPRSYYQPFFGKGYPVYSDVPDDKYLTDKLTDDAIAYMERQTGKTPFLLSLFYYSIHSPHVGRKDLLKKYEARGFEGKAAHHAAMFEAVDESVGRIREALNRNNLGENTVVFFLGDQGGLFENAPLRGGKPAGVALYEGGARIPCSVYWPGVTEAGSVSAEPVTTLDVFPTMVSIAGGNTLAYQNLDGDNLVPLLKDKRKAIGRDAIYLYRSYDDQYAAMRSGPLKLLARRSGRHELYDLSVDLSEENNLIHRNPEQAAAMLRKLTAWELEMGVLLREER